MAANSETLVMSATSSHWLKLPLTDHASCLLNLALWYVKNLMSGIPKLF